MGRLLEIVADAGYRTAEDVDLMFDKIQAEVARLPAPGGHVTVVDWSHCPVLTPVAVRRMGERIAASNAQTVRSAALAVPDASVALLQFLRVIREAGHPDRRLFFSASELASWLDEVLAPAESARLRQFLTPAPFAPRPR